MIPCTCSVTLKEHWLWSFATLTVSNNLVFKWYPYIILFVSTPNTVQMLTSQRISSMFSLGIFLPDTVFNYLICDSSIQFNLRKTWNLMGDLKLIKHVLFIRWVALLFCQVLCVRVCFEMFGGNGDL